MDAFLYQIILIISLFCDCRSICDRGQDCLVNCNDNPSDCYNSTINGSNANSLTVTCSNMNNCSFAEIQCPLFNSCTIYCHGSSSCIDTIIAGNNSDVLDIYCTHYNNSCNSVKIMAHYANNVNIHCDTSSNNIDPNSISNSHSSAPFACNKLHIYANNTNNLKLNCIGDYCMYLMYLHAEYSKNISLYFNGAFAGEKSYIFSNHASNVSITCASGDYAGLTCNQMNIYLADIQNPDHISTHLICKGFGCRYLTFYNFNNIKASLNVTALSCNACSAENCLSRWYLHCGSSGYNYYYGGSFYCRSWSTDYCECSELYHMTDISPFDAETCDDVSIPQYALDGDICIFNCSQIADHCMGKLLNGTYCNNLTLICDGHSCNDMKIYCPRNDNTSCNIRCDDGYCSAMDIYANGPTRLNVQCTHNKACSNLLIRADFAKSIDLLCKGAGNDWPDGACQGHRIYGNNVSDYVHIICQGKESCVGYYYPKIEVISANKVFIEMLGDLTGYPPIYAYNASYFELTASSKTYNAYHGSIYGPRTKSKINCQGFGCGQIVFISKTSSDMNTKFNGYHNYDIEINGCGQCNSISECTDDVTWYLDCDGRSTHWGNQCSPDRHCNCYDKTPNATFINQALPANCWFITDSPSNAPTTTPTISPTSAPTIFSDNPSVIPTNNPTQPPTYNPSDNPSYHPTLNPTLSPTLSPTFAPIINPTISPTQNPFSSPTYAPILKTTLSSDDGWSSSITIHYNTEGDAVKLKSYWSGLFSVILIVGILFVICLVLLFGYYLCKKRNSKMKNVVSFKQFLDLNEDEENDIDGVALTKITGK